MRRISLRGAARWLVPSLLVTAVAMVPAASAQAATGGLDTTFGVQGRASVGGAEDIAFRSDGKLWVIGVSARRTSTGFLTGKARVRLDGNGHADPTFVAAPVVTPYEGLSAGEQVITPAGGSVSSWDNCCNAFDPIEYTNLDYVTVSGRPANFGAFAQGYRAPGFVGPDDRYHSPQLAGGLLRLPDGRFRFCFNQGPAIEGGDPQSAVLWGLLADGTPDPAVGPGGFREIPGLDSCGTRAAADRGPALSRGLFLDRDGRMYIIGRTITGPQGQERDSVAILRTDVNGAMDTTYGSGGRFTLTASTSSYVPTDAEVTQSGTVFLGMNVQATAAGSQPAATIAKLTSAGVLDPAFGSGGLKRFTVAGGSTEVDSLGTLQGSRLAVAMTYIANGQRSGRLTAVSATTAQPDRAFGSNGSIKTGLRVFDTAIQGTNRLLLAGQVVSTDPADDSTDPSVVERRIV